MVDAVSRTLQVLTRRDEARVSAFTTAPPRQPPATIPQHVFNEFDQRDLSRAVELAARMAEIARAEPAEAGLAQGLQTTENALGHEPLGLVKYAIMAHGLETGGSRRWWVGRTAEVPVRGFVNQRTRPD